MAIYDQPRWPSLFDPHSLRMTTPDIRAFYKALGIELPGWPKLEAPVRCFAQPDAHNHADRSPSCSINLASGAWNCHGCGARGGAYDAALAVGHTPRSAIDLLIANGLAEPRTHAAGRTRKRRQSALPGNPHPRQAGPGSPSTACTFTRGQRCSTATVASSDDSSWSGRGPHESCAHSKLGSTVRASRSPSATPADTSKASSATTRSDHAARRCGPPWDPIGLIPHPSSEASNHIILVEGPPDMISARSAGLPAIAIPGTNAWHPSWADLFAGKRVTIVMDCDAPGRRAAGEIATSLDKTAEAVEVVDLSPGRDDGYDLTDRILELRLVKREIPHALSTVRLLFAPHPTYGPRGSELRTTSYQRRRA